MAHITGGGVPGNLPRVLNGLGAKVSRNAVPEQNVFQQLCAAGNVERDESWKAFNMGVGMILVVDPASEEEFLSALSAQGQTAFAMGEISADVEGVAWLD